MKSHLQILLISMLLLTGCSLWASGIIGNPIKIQIDKPISEVSELRSMIENAYLWRVFTGSFVYTYSGRTDTKWGYNQANSQQIPGVVMDFIELNTGSVVLGMIPYFDNHEKIVWHEFLIVCDNKKFCASFYEFNSDFQKYPYGSRWTETVFRIKSTNSPSVRLSKIFGTYKNQYFHGQYAMRISDGMVKSLDPLDTDITNTGALFHRMSLMMNESELREFTKLVHDRFYLSGGLSNHTGVLMPYERRYLSGGILMSEHTYLTWVLLKNKDSMKVPTWLNGWYDPKTGTSEVHYDGYEIQLFDTEQNTHWSEIYVNNQLESHSDNGIASYIYTAISYGTFSFDRTMSRTTGAVFSSPPLKMTCITLVCPEDDEFVYP